MAREHRQNVIQCLNTHVQYESPIASSKKVMAKVKVFVHASHGRRRGRYGYDICSPDIRPSSLKRQPWLSIFFLSSFIEIYAAVAEEKRKCGQQIKL